MDEKIQEAMRKGECIARAHNMKTLIPFPFKEIFEKENISFAYLPDNKRWRGISGAIRFFGDEARIFVKESDSQERQSFTIAHELGHYFLHREEVRERSSVFDGENVLMMYRSGMGLSDDKERAANYFAGSLLMPEKRVKEAWGDFGNIEKCAKLFFVSPSAMAVRLSVLGFID